MYLNNTFFFYHLALPAGLILRHRPDVFMAVHVHGVELLLLLDLLLIGSVLDALQHLISDVFRKDGQQ